MTKTILCISGVLVFILSIGILGCGSENDTDMSDPVNCVRGYLKAYEDNDFERVATYWGEDLSDSVLESMKQEAANISFSFSNLNIAVISQTETDATIAVSYDYEVRIVDSTPITSDIIREQIEMTVELVKNNENWIITDAFDSADIT